MKRILILLVALLLAVAMGAAWAGSDIRVTSDGSATLCAGAGANSGARAVDILANGGDGRVIFWRTRNVGPDSMSFFLRDGIARTITAQMCGFTLMDSITNDLNTSTEHIYTVHR